MPGHLRAAAPDEVWAIDFVTTASPTAARSQLLHDVLPVLKTVELGLGPITVDELRRIV